MKKIMLTLLCFVWLSTLWATGQGEDVSGDGPVTLVLWHEAEPEEAAILERNLNQFEDIKVEVVRKESVTEALKLSAGDSDSAPDLFWYAHDKIGLFCAMDVLEPLDNWIETDFSSFIPMTVKAGEFAGRNYQVPVFFETLLMMYNKDLVTEIPGDTEELLSMMKNNPSAAEYFFVEQHSTAYYAAAWINGFDGYIINGNGEPGLSDPRTVAGVEYHKKFVPYMPSDGEWNTVITLFNTGQAAMTINGPWIVSGAKEAGVSLGYAPLPIIPKTGKALSPFAGVKGLMMLSSSNNKEAAGKVMSLLMDKKAGEDFALSLGSAPAHMEAYSNEAISGNDLVMAMKEAGLNASPMPNVPQMDLMWMTTENALASIYKNGGETEVELLKQQKESELLIADMK